jgi:hypothetical protein
MTDHNKLRYDSLTEQTMALRILADRFRRFTFQDRRRAEGPDPSGMKLAAPHPRRYARRPLPGAWGEVFSGQLREALGGGAART